VGRLSGVRVHERPSFRSRRFSQRSPRRREGARPAHCHRGILHGRPSGRLLDRERRIIGGRGLRFHHIFQ
jgi:hypothetical protein